MECLLPYLCMVTVPHIMVGLERMLDYRGVGLGRFTVFDNCTWIEFHYIIPTSVCPCVNCMPLEYYIDINTGV